MRLPSDQEEYGGEANPHSQIESASRKLRLAGYLRQAARVLAVSPSFAAVYRATGLPNVVAVPNGLPELPPLEATPARPRKVRLGHVGGLAHHKGIHLLKQALIRGHYPDLDVLAVDYAMHEGEERRELWGPTEVRIIGKVPQHRINWLYGQFDVLVAPSLWPESFGLVTREAAAYGVPSSITGRMVTTKPGQMAWLTRAELESMGVRVIERRTTAGDQVAPGSSRSAPSDWTRGFEQGRSAGEATSCSPPSDIGDKEDWRLGCESGRRSRTASVAGARPGGKALSDWSKGFEFGREGGSSADCSAPGPGIADPDDWSRGCESGRNAGGG